MICWRTLRGEANFYIYSFLLKHVAYKKKSKPSRNFINSVMDYLGIKPQHFLKLLQLGIVTQIRENRIITLNSIWEKK